MVSAAGEKEDRNRQFSFRFTTPILERRVLVDFNRSVSGHGSQR